MNRNSVFFYIFLILCFFTSLEANNKPLVFDNFKMQMFEDKSANLNFKDIKNIEFNKTVSNKIAIGSSKSVFWYKFSFTNSTNSQLVRYLDISESFIHIVDLYVVNGKGDVSLSKNGLSVRVSEKKIKDKFPIFELNFFSKETKTLYLKIEGKLQIYTEVKLLDKQTLTENKITKTFYIGIYFGSLLALLLYNIFIYTSLKDRVYLYYIGYVASFLVWQIQINGYFFKDISADFYYSTSFVVPLWLGLLIFFSRDILETKAYSPTLDRVLKIFAYAFIVLIFTSVFETYYTFLILNHLVSISLPILVLVGFFSYKSGNRIAHLYLYGILFFIAMSTLFSFMVQGLLPYNIFTRYGIVFGSFVETIFFSFALAHRIYILKEEKLKLEIDAKQLLEKEVRLRTKELSDLNVKLSEMAYVDYLTSAYNRRYFYYVAKDMISLAKRENSPMSVAVIDIDDFKNINDIYGHDMGDKIIKLLTDKTREFLRKSDILARFGGDEFVILFPNTSVKKAKIVIEKIRKILEKDTNFIEIFFTISAGLSELSDKDEDVDTILKRADNALYGSKNSGKNRVLIA